MRTFSSDRAALAPSILDSRLYDAATEYARYVASLPAGVTISDPARTQQLIADLIASGTYSAATLAFGGFSGLKNMNAVGQQVYSVGRNAMLTNATSGLSGFLQLNTTAYTFHTLRFGNSAAFLQWANLPIRQGNAFSLLMMMPSSPFGRAEGARADFSVGSLRHLMTAGSVTTAVVDSANGNALAFPAAPPSASFAPQIATPPNMIATWHVDCESRKLWTSISGQDVATASREYPNYPAPAMGAVAPTFTMDQTITTSADIAELIFLSGPHNREQVAQLAHLRRSRYPA